MIILEQKKNEFDRHNIDNFRRFDHYLAKHGVKSYVLGVIPSFVKLVDLRWLGENERVVVAQHGVVHSESTLNEFDGLHYASIQESLRVGRDRLEGTLGTLVTDYIPPHNVIDANTILALSRLGFYRVFGGPGMDDEMKEMFSCFGIEYCHSEPPLEYGRSDELLERGSVEYLEKEVEKRELRDGSDVWLTLHWTWECNIGFDNLDTYIGRLSHLF